MPKYLIRDADDNDVQGIAGLRIGIKEFTTVKVEDYISLWEYLIKKNPCRIQKALVAADNEKRIVAHYAIVPFKFIMDNKTLLGGFLCQLMIDEKYRQELIFPRMEMKFLKEYEKLGYDFAFSLGNRAHVVKAHLSFGFTQIGDLPVYAKPYKLSKIVPHLMKSRILNILARPALYAIEKVLRFKRPSYSKHIEIAQISGFDPDIDQFFSTVKKYFPYCAVRDSVTLNWRFADSHEHKYRMLIAREKGIIVGYAVLRRMTMKQFDVLAIVDILFSPERHEAGKALLRSVHELALEMNVDMSCCMLNQYDPLCPALLKSGYFKTPETFSLFVHERKGTAPHFSTDSFYKWHLTWFDNDAV